MPALRYFAVAHSRTASSNIACQDNTNATKWNTTQQLIHSAYHHHQYHLIIIIIIITTTTTITKIATTMLSSPIYNTNKTHTSRERAGTRLTRHLPGCILYLTRNPGACKKKLRLPCKAPASTLSPESTGIQRIACAPKSNMRAQP